MEWHNHFLEFSPEIRGGRRSKLFKNLFKNIFFLVVWLNSGIKEGIWGENGKMGGVLRIEANIVKIPLQSPGKESIVTVVSLFSTRPSLRSGRPTPINIIFSRLTRIDILLNKVYGFEVENCGHKKQLKLGDF